MDNLILHPTDTSQWYALVNEAQVKSLVTLDEEVESYLVFLLMRYSQCASVVESIIALDFLDTHKLAGQSRVSSLKEVGDKSLLFCGLFPGMAKRRRVSDRYFIDIGQSAYLTVSELELNHGAELFFNLSQSFETLRTILKNLYLSN